MSETRYCIIDGSSFETDDPNEVLCPHCRRAASSQQDTIDYGRAADRTLPPIPTWMPGYKLLNQFKVINLISESGQSRVYQVEHQRSGRMLAVKLPRLAFFQGAALEVVKREAEILFLMHHDLCGIEPNVIQINRARLWQGIPLIFTEYGEGRDLSQAIQDSSLYIGGKQLALKRIFNIAIKSAWGLASIHQKRVVHGDLKPGNILLIADDQVRITGFELAQVLADGQDCVPCQGYTPAFASPEQVRNDPISTKSDLWNWGVTVLVMFTGEITWLRGISADKALVAYLDESEFDADLPAMPAALAAALQRCFRADPVDRPESMNWVARRMVEIYEHVFGETYYPLLLDFGLQPASLDFLLHRGAWYFELGDFERAVQQFEQAIENYPQCAWARFNLGLTLLNLNPENRQAALTYFDPLPSYQDPGFSVGQVSSHFMSVLDIQVDPERRFLWIAGDIGIALFGDPCYAPYDFSGINLGPEQLPEYGDPQRWFRYNNVDGWPWQLQVNFSSHPEIGKNELSSQDFSQTRKQIFCQECGRDVSFTVGRDAFTSQLEGLVDCLCPRCAEGRILPDGPVFGEYQPLKCLARNQIGTYYCAWHRLTYRVVRLEDIDIDENHRYYPHATSWYHQNWRDLEHPNLALPFDEGKSETCDYRVYELEQGTELETYLDQQGGVMPIKQAADIICQILDGLAYLHQKGLVHRNINPGSILVKVQEESVLARLSDFELLKCYSNGSGDEETDFSIGGDFAFVAPEQATHFNYVKPTADIFSVGATFYYLLTGCYPLPFPGRSKKYRSGQEDPLMILLKQTPVPIRDRLPDLGSEIVEVIDKAVCRNAEDRFQTAIAFKQALLTALKGIKNSQIDATQVSLEQGVDTIVQISAEYLGRITVQCARCGMDISELANSDGRAVELADDVIYWCSDCAWRQFPFQAYPMNEMGFVEYQGLGGGLASSVLGWQTTSGRVATIRRVYFWRDREESTKNLLADYEQLTRIVHPNCTRIIQTASSGSGVLVASTYLQEATFGELVGNFPGGTLACQAAVTAGLKLLDGLEQMHTLGYTHANLHPGNILFKDGDFSKPKICLADFSPNYVYSFACYDPERDSPLVNSATLPLLVPELILGTSRRDPAWDLYSLGQMLYFLLTGTTSFEVPKNINPRDWNRLTDALLKNEPLSIQEREPKIPTQLAHLIDRAVKKRPEERFISLAEFRHELQQVLEE